MQSRCVKKGYIPVVKKTVLIYLRSFKLYRSCQCFYSTSFFRSVRISVEVLWGCATMCMLILVTLNQPHWLTVNVSCLWNQQSWQSACHFACFSSTVLLKLNCLKVTYFRFIALFRSSVLAVSNDTLCCNAFCR